MKSPLCPLGMALLFLLATRGNAETFSCDFNSGLPANTKIYGHAKVDTFGGADGSGALKLTIAASNQEGAFIIDSPEDANPISSFTATFKALIDGGRGGGGFSFCFAPDLANGVITENGAGSGLVVSFDTYKNKIDNFAPAIRVHWQKKLIGEMEVALRKGRFADVFVQMTSDGKLNLAYDGATVFTNLSVGSMNMPGRFAFGSRTGGFFDNHWIDDLNITSEAGMPSFIEAFLPADDNAAPDAAVEIMFIDWSKVRLQSVRLKLDGVDVTPLAITNRANVRLLQYQPPDLLEPGSAHAVQLAFEDQNNPPLLHSFTYRFSVNPNIILHK